MIRIKIIIAAIVAALAGLATFGASKKRDGAKEVKQEAMKQNEEKKKEGRNAAAKEQAQTDGLSKRDILERLRGRDGDFGGM